MSCSLETGACLDRITESNVVTLVTMLSLLLVVGLQAVDDVRDTANVGAAVIPAVIPVSIGVVVLGLEAAGGTEEACGTTRQHNETYNKVLGHLLAFSALLGYMSTSQQGVGFSPVRRLSLAACFVAVSLTLLAMSAVEGRTLYVDTNDEKVLDDTRGPSLLYTSFIALLACLFLFGSSSFLMMAAVCFAVLSSFETQLHQLAVGIVCSVLTIAGISKFMRFRYLIPAILAAGLNVLVVASSFCPSRAKDLRYYFIVSGLLLLLVGSTSLFYDEVEPSFARTSSTVQLAISTLLVLFAVCTNMFANIGLDEDTQRPLLMAIGGLLALLTLPRVVNTSHNQDNLVGLSPNQMHGSVWTDAYPFLLLSVYLTVSFVSQVASVTTHVMAAVMILTSAIIGQIQLGPRWYYPHLLFSLAPLAFLLLRKEGKQENCYEAAPPPAATAATAEPVSEKAPKEEAPKEEVSADISKECFEESPEHGTICVKAKNNKCRRSYCIDTSRDPPPGVGLAELSKNRDLLAVRCHAHLRAFRAASKAMDNGTATPAQRFCVMFHSWDDCVETCDSYWSSSGDPLTLAAIQRMKSRLEIIDDSILFMTPEEWLQTRAVSR